MNKRIKLISSVALAGVLAINVCNPKTLAATIDDYGSKLKGTHNGMAQFVLEDITDSAKINGRTIKTGETIDINGTSYTAIVYGDANSDGRVNANDAAYILKSLTGYEGVTLNDAQKEAANVYRVGSANVSASNARDAVNILKFCTGSQLTEGVTFAFDGEEPVEEDENFTISFDSEYVNNVSEKANGLNVKIDLKELLEEASTNFTIEIDDSNDSTSAVSQSLSIANNEITKTVPISTALSTLDNGILTVKLKNSEGTVIRIARIEKKSADTSIANITTNRLNSTEATISFEGMGAYDIKNVYYTIDTSAPTNPTNESEKISVSGNKVTNVPLKGLTAAGAHAKYTVKMLVEDIYGNISSSNATSAYPTATVLTEEEQADKLDKVSVTLDESITNKVTFNVTKIDGTTPNDQNLKYVLYKDGKIIAEDTVISNQNKIEIESSDLNGVGAYKISVVAQASNKADSDATEATFEVKQLNSVSSLIIAEDNDKLKIDWTKSSETSCAGYEIKVYPLKADGTVDTTATATIQIANKDTNSDNSKSLGTDIAKDRAYVAKIKATHGTNIFFEDSEETTSNQVVILNTSSLSISTNSNTSNSITLAVANQKNIPGVTSTYTLRVYNDNGANLGLATRYTLLKEISPVIENNKIVVDGLEAGKAYGFDLIEKIGNVENITSTINSAILSASTKAQAPVVNGLTVATYESGKVASDYTGKIAYDSTNNKIYINGLEYGTTSGDYTTESLAIANIVATLKAEDKITINDNVVTLDLVNAIQERNFAATLSGKELVVNCNTKVEKTLTATSGSAPSKVILNGTGALYTVSGLNKDVIVNSGVANIVADTTQKVTLSSNVSTTINGVKVSTKAGATVVVNSGDVTVHVDASKTDSELSFENNGDITFTTTDTTNKTTLAGTVAINTTKPVTIATSGVAVDASINVISAATVTDNATTKVIDLTAPRGLNGTKSVTVNKDAKSTVKFNVNQHIVDEDGNDLDLNNGTILKTTGLSLASTNAILQSWEADGLISAADANGYYNETEVNAAIAQLSKFGIDDANATLTITSNVATIVFSNGATKTVTIGNIK